MINPLSMMQRGMQGMQKGQRALQPFGFNFGAGNAFQPNYQPNFQTQNQLPPQQNQFMMQNPMMGGMGMPQRALAPQMGMGGMGQADTANVMPFNPGYSSGGNDNFLRNKKSFF